MIKQQHATLPVARGALFTLLLASAPLCAAAATSTPDQRATADDAAATSAPTAIEVPVSSNMSLVHVGSNDSFATTREGNQAARDLFAAINAYNDGDLEGAREKAAAARATYDLIIPRENYGGEYTALQWFCDYLLADASARAEMVADPFVAEFFKMYGGDGFKVLKEYLMRKYRVALIGDEDSTEGEQRKIYLEDTILFNNPRRESWEHTSELLQLVDVHAGMRIADVGAGPGYYAFRFAKRVGPEGEVFAIDTNAEHLAYLDRTKERLGVNNVRTIQTDGKSLGLADEQVDAVFLCSLYHNVYAMSTAPARDAFVQAIKDALSDDGLLYLADNGLVPRGVLPYHGPYVAKELVIAQLLNYGFELVRQHQHIPQRYLLVFKKAAADSGTPLVSALEGTGAGAAEVRH